MRVFATIIMLLLILSSFSVAEHDATYADDEAYEDEVRPTYSEPVEVLTGQGYEPVERILGRFFEEHREAYSEQDKSEMMGLCDQPEVLARKMLDKLRQTADGDLTNMCAETASCLRNAMNMCAPKEKSPKCPPDKEELMERCLLGKDQTEAMCEKEYYDRCVVRAESVRPKKSVPPIPAPAQSTITERKTEHMIDCPLGKEEMLKRCLLDRKEPELMCEKEYELKCLNRPLPMKERVRQQEIIKDGNIIRQETATTVYTKERRVEYRENSGETSAITGNAIRIYESDSQQQLKKYKRNLITGQAIEEVAGEVMPLGEQSAETMPVRCTEEAKICQDGTAVGRTGPNCEFAPCPATGTKPRSYCGDGVCQNYACMGLDCPAPETTENCPQDCSAKNCPVDTPMPPCSGTMTKKIDSQGCPHYYCQETRIMCGNGACEMGEQECPPCSRNNPPCPTFAACGMCPGDCKTSQCPVYDVFCAPGTRAVETGADEKGCPLPPRCVDDNGCPPTAVPMCEGSELSKEVDEKGCPRYHCKSRDYCEKGQFLEECKKRYRERPVDYKEKCYDEMEHRYGDMQRRCEEIGNEKERCREYAKKQCRLPEDCPKLVNEERLYQLFLSKAKEMCRYRYAKEPTAIREIQTIARDASEEHKEELKQKSEELEKAHEEVKEIEQAEEERGIGYKFKSLFGLMKDQEMSEATRIRDNMARLDETIKVLEKVSQSLSDPIAQAAIESQVKALKEQHDQLEGLAKEKEKRAKGLFGLF